MAEKDADVQKIEELIQIMKENDLVRLDIQHGDDRISLERAQPHAPIALSPALTAVPAGTALSAVPNPPAAPGAGAEGLVDIKSPIVGTFYEAPSPDSEPYVEPGTHVDPQAVVCIIEAMKVMNEIKAEIGGVIVERVAANGQAVEYGQVLFRVRPD